MDNASAVRPRPPRRLPRWPRLKLAGAVLMVAAAAIHAAVRQPQTALAAALVVAVAGIGAACLGASLGAAFHGRGRG